MASIIKVGDRWRAQVRRKGHPTQTKTFGTRILAERWARQIEADIDAGRAGLAPSSAGSVRELIERYQREIGPVKPFGRNKSDVLLRIAELLGAEPAAELTTERLVRYIREDRRIKGVTAAIDLTYLKGMLRVARALWRLPVRPEVVDEARDVLRYTGQLERSQERDRRPTTDELDRLRGWFGVHSNSLTPDLFDFILDSCFRPPSEIVRLRWDDIHHQDRTIVIRDRKDPRRKLGNHMTVPLLGRCYDIVMRQPRTSELIWPVNGKSWSSLFPRACRALGIEDLTLYDMRHEAISRLVESGKYSIPEMMLVTGHRDPRQLMRYTQLRARDLHR